MFAARFDDFASQALRDFDGFSNGAPFGNQARDIWTRTEIASLFQIFDAHSDRYFSDFGQMLLTFHENSPSMVDLPLL